MTTIIKSNVPKKGRNNNSNTIYNTGGTTIIQGGTTPVLDTLNSDSSTSALSAKQGKILNNKKPDRNRDEIIDGRYEFTNGLTTNNVSTEGVIKTVDYSVTNDKGAALYPNADYSQWNGVLDNLRVRGKLDIMTLQIEEAKHIGGNIYLTKAGFKCTKVEKITQGTPAFPEVRYKCYFRAIDNDGLVIYNQFQMGDLAFCQTWNNNQVRKWWRAVHGVGRDWILVDDVQKLEGSSIPQEGDVIVQLGSLNNLERQNAVVLWTDAICLYKGINDFILPEPFIRLDPKNTKIDADVIEFLGKTMINGNFVVDNSGNLSVKGHIIATSGEFTGTIKANEGNIGNFTIKDGGLFNDTSTNERANITITDNPNPSKATISFIVNPRNLAPEEKGAIVDVSHRVPEGDGIIASTTNGNAIWGITEDGQALTGYATGIGYGLLANRANIRGLYLNVANIKFDGDDEDRLINLDEVDIVKLGKAIKKPKTIVLPIISYNIGRRITIVNGSGISHKIISQTLENGLNEQLEYLNGRTPTIDVDKGNGEIVQVFGFAIERYTAVELLNTGDAWTIINVYR